MTSVVSTVDSLKMVSSEPENKGNVGVEKGDSPSMAGVGEQPSYGMETDDSPNVSASESSSNAKETAVPTDVGIAKDPASTQSIGRVKHHKLDAKSSLAAEYEMHITMTLHSLASQHFLVRQFWVFEVNQSLFTMISGILAFVATTDLVTEDRTVTMLTTIVGSTAIIVGFLQAMNGLCSYKARGVMHEAVAIDLRDMRNSMRMLRTKLGFGEIYDLNTDDKGTINPAGGGNESEYYEQDTFESIQSKFEQCLFGCKSAVPLELNEAFDGLASVCKMMCSTKNLKYRQDRYGDKFPGHCFQIRFYDILAAQISSHPLFPLIVPDSKKALEKATEIYRTEYNEFSAFYEEKKEKE